MVGKNIMDKKRFLKCLVKAQSVPGPIAINTAFFVGSEIGGIPLGIFLVLSVFLPPFITILLVATFLWHYIEVPYVRYFLVGVRIGISVILIDFIYRITKKWRIRNFVLILTGMLLIIFLKLHTIYTFILISALYFLIIRGEK
ncbi:MAG: hypothetical protein DRI28_04230 [Caldiserica bacterium]|nr:MAG: hypothetical protein DRI28_04230 [Caldisericota bacterium]